MDDLYYKIKREVQQDSMDCVQANTVQFLSHYGINKTVLEVKNEVPVFIDSTGTPQGTSIGHIAAYLLNLDFKVTAHVADVELFDMSWTLLPPQELIEKIKARQKKLKHAVYGPETVAAICEGYILFLQKGGKITFPAVSVEYIHKLLSTGPIFAALNYQFAFERPKFSYNKEKNDLDEDPIGGLITTHAMLITGYKTGKFCLLDPDGSESHDDERWVDANRVVGSYYLAESNLDPILITLEK